MSTPAVRDIARRVAEVAKRTAIQQSPIVEGTVIGRNPDGSLVVDTGTGGCARVAPRANVRVGERIRLGTEPALGRQTNLQQISVVISPSSIPCPDDPRGECDDIIGSPCSEPEETVSLPIDGANQSFQWVSRLNPDFPLATWDDRLEVPVASGEIHGTGQGTSIIARRYSGSLVHTYPGSPWPDELRFQVIRNHNLFDTSGVPANSTVVEARLALHFSTTELPFFHDDLGDEAIYVVPGYSDGTTSADNWYLYSPTPLGGISLADLTALSGGSGLPVDVEIDLHDAILGVSLSQLIQRGPGAVTGLMLIMGRDLFGPDHIVVDPPPPISLIEPPTYTGPPGEVELVEGGPYSLGFVSLTVVTADNLNL